MPVHEVGFKSAEVTNSEKPLRDEKTARKHEIHERLPRAMPVRTLRGVAAERHFGLHRWVRAAARGGAALPSPREPAVVCTHLLTARAACVAVPSPLVGEGYSQVQRRRMGEGFCLLHEPLTHFELADAPEMPSPTGGEGTITAASLAARSTTSPVAMCESDSREAGRTKGTARGAALTTPACRPVRRGSASRTPCISTSANRPPRCPCGSRPC